MKRICTRACIGTFYGSSAVKREKLTFQIHAKDKVEFLKVKGGVIVGKLIRNNQNWYFTVSRKTANDNFGVKSLG